MGMKGRRYGKLVVMGRISSKPDRVICRCDCGEDFIIPAPNLIQGRTKHCGCEKYADRDETGKRYGRWTVIGKHDGSFEYWECKCDCGSEGVVSRSALIGGNSQSCGCLQRERVTESGKGNRMDIIGQRFGRLVVLGSVLDNSGNLKSWRCRCDCGKEKEIGSSSLCGGGKTKSCGCLAREVARAKWIVPELSESDREANKERRADPRNTEWVDFVLKRDGHVCQACGARGYVIAHHKNAWALFPESRFDVTNGVTACFGCHSDFHSIYGSGRNTEQQWNDFESSRLKTGNVEAWCKKKYAVAVGEKHGRLTVMERVKNEKGRTMWRCICECGKEHVAGGNALKFGQVK